MLGAGASQLTQATDFTAAKWSDSAGVIRLEFLLRMRLQHHLVLPLWALYIFHSRSKCFRVKYYLRAQRELCDELRQIARYSRKPVKRGRLH